MIGTIGDLALVVGQSLVIYVYLILFLSLVGRRQMAQLTLIEYLIIALLGSSVETGLYAGNTSLPAGLVSAGTILVANRVLDHIMTRWRPLRRLLLAPPILLVSDGQIIQSHLHAAHLTEKDVMAAVRLRGYDSLDAVRFAVLEPNGAIGVVPADSKRDTSGKTKR